MTNVLNFPTNKAKPDRGLVARWGGHADIFRDGYVGVPTTFLRSLNKMALPYRIAPAEAMLVIQLMAYKWSSEAPYPGYKTLAAFMGITPVYARQLARRLEEKKLLRRVVRIGSTNQFDLTPLFEKLAKHVGGGTGKTKAKPKARPKTTKKRRKVASA